MNIGDIKPGTHTVEIINPRTSLPLGVRVVLVSLEDESMRRLKRAQQQKAMDRESKGKTLKVDDLHHDLDNMIFQAMKSWEWYDPTPESKEDTVPTWKGEPSPDMNLKTVREIFTVLPWFKGDVSEGLSDTENFFKD